MATIIKVDRSLWLRGEEASKNPVLYDPSTKKYDFLGKLLATIGYEYTYLKGFRWPSQAINKVHGTRESPPRSLQWLISKAHADTAECIRIALLNDDPTITDEVREREITRILADNVGYMVEFYDPAPTKKEIWETEMKPSKKEVFDPDITWDVRSRGWTVANV
jgi:hypothetical protein